MEKIRILIADDIKEVVNNLKYILEKLEEVEIIGIALDGQEEYDKIIEMQPDLVFTDNKMPKMTGIEVIEKINKETIIENKPDFVLVTSDRNYSLIQRMYELNIITIISKPFDKENILNAIEQFKETKIEINKESFVKPKGFINKLINKFNKKKEV